MNSFARKLSFLVLCCLSADAFALGRQVAYDEIFKYHINDITRITTCGHWEAGENSGPFRIVELDMYGQSFVYIERLGLNADRSGLTVVDGTGIEEFNNDHADYQLGKAVCKPAKDGISIHVVAAANEYRSIRKIKIEFNADASYKIKGI